MVNTTIHLSRWVAIGVALMLGLAVGIGLTVPRQATAQQTDDSDRHRQQG
jgi:hypothetical protein